MKKKEKLILSVVIFGIGTIFNLFFTAALHGLLSRRYYTLTLIPLWDCIAGLFTQRQQSLLFLSFEGFICLCGVLFWVQNNRPYQSELVRVTEDIYTPVPVGQYQHGSARWLRDTEKRKVFGTQVISPQNELIRELLDTGYSDLPFMQKKKDVQADTGQSTAVQDETAGLPPVAIEKQEEKEGLVQDEDFETVDYDLAAAGFTQPPQETPDSASAEQESNEKEADPYQLFPEGGIVVGMDRIGGK